MRRQKGEGSVTQRGDGRWMGSFVVDTPKGKGRKYVYAKTQRDCTRALNDARERYRRTGGVSADMTLAVWLDRWLNGLEADKTVRARTLAASYRPKAANISEAIGRHKLDRLTPDHVKVFYRQLRDQGAAQATIEQHHRILSKAIKDAYQDGHVGRNVMDRVPTPKIGRAAKKPDRMTQEDVKAIRRQLHGDRLAARWLFQLTLGCRQSEVLGLGWEDVDFDAQAVTIRRKVERVGGRHIFDEPKSDTSNRVLALPPHLLDALRSRHERWLTEPRPDLSDRGDLAPFALVFGRPDNGLPYDDKVDRKAWRELLVRAGVDPKYGTHAARRAVATEGANRGTPVKVLQGILGHADSGMTLDTYAGLDLAAQRLALTQLEAAMWSDGSG